jgi:hypothetical protein
MADKFKEFQKRFKAGKVKMLANPPPIPGPGGIARAVGGKVVKEVVKKTVQPRPAKDLKQSNPKDLRNKALREANKLASEAAKANKTAASSGPKTRGLTRKQKITSTAAGILAGGGIAGAIYASSSGPKTRAYKASMKEAPSSSSKYAGYGNKTSSAAYGYTPKKAGPIMPTVSMAGGGVNKPGAKGGVNQFDIAAQNAKDKKKAGATTGATTAAPAKAKPKRRTNLDRMRRRQAERFAISSSGRPL